MVELIADLLSQDPKFLRAKKQILATVAKFKKHITQPKPPLPGLSQSYADTLARFAHCRGMPLWYPYLGSGFGNGALVELADGSVKFDFISGIAVHWGHCHLELVEACLDSAVQNTVMQGHLQQNRDSYQLTELLLQGSGMDHCILTTSGAMACENALKVLLQYKTPGKRILAFDRCFMGRTLALAQISDKPAFREGLPLDLLVDYVPFYDWQDPAGSTEKALDALRKHLNRYPGQHACMCFEMIQGEAGYYPGSPEFFTAIMKMLKEHGVPVFVDEIQSFGRTDCLFAFQHFGLEEYVDVITVGKLLHVCATLYRSAVRPKPGLISQTFTGSTSSIRGAIVILKSLLNEGYLGKKGKNLQIRKYFVDGLNRIAEKYPHQFQGPYGHGLMIAFTPLHGEREKVTALAHDLFNAGLIVFIAGMNPTRIRMVVPAGGVQMENIDHACTLIEDILKKHAR